MKIFAKHFLFVLSRNIKKSLFWLALVCCISFTSASQAATIEFYNDKTMGCSMLLTGQIQEGDSAKLESLSRKKIQEGGYVGRLCLNSSGGSFAEGVRLANTISGMPNLGTAIAGGHVCESACAIAFMAGGWTEGGYGNVKPIMHPQAKLGFHAPSIEIPEGQYTHEQVDSAWSVALKAVAEMVKMRSSRTVNDVSSSYRFPEDLFYEMLTTSSDTMFYIDTVGKAAQFEIHIHPAGINADSVQLVFLNACKNSTGFNGFLIEGSPIILEVLSSSGVEIFTETGFGEEARQSCQVKFFLKRKIFARQGLFIDGKSKIWPKENVQVYSYMTFEGSTPINQIPVNVEDSFKAFIAKVKQFKRANPPNLGCHIVSERPRISNVNEFTNLRANSGIDNRIIARVPLGAAVDQTEPGTYWVGDQCLRSCKSDNQAGINQCIDNNKIWIEVEYNGRRGFLSRKFLVEAP